MKSFVFLTLCIILLVCLFDRAAGTGVLTVNYISFNSMGRRSSGDYCDLCISCYSPCDPIFEICLRFGHTTSSFRCDDTSVVPKIYTPEYVNTDAPTFYSPIDGDIINPVAYSTDSSFNGDFEISLYVTDEDGIFSDDYIDTIIARISATKRTSFSSTVTYEGTRSSYKTTADIQYKFVCDANYYNTYCTHYCLAQFNNDGNYNCDPTNGAKICITGFMGADCDIGICTAGFEWEATSHSCKDINECTLGTNQCEQICGNTDGSYLCSCMTDYYLSSSTECSVITFTTLISGYAPSSSSLQIDWDTSFIPATHTVSLSYQVYYRDITFSVPSYTYHGETNSLQQDISNLLPYRDYQLYVDAIGSLTNQTSNTVTVTTDQNTPSESPTNVSALTLSATEISLSWFAPSRESQNGVLEYYVILINVTSSSYPGWTTTQINVTASSTFHTITGLQPYTAYTLSVSAATFIGRGPYSPSTTVFTHESTPTQHPRLSVTSKPHSTISLTLHPPTDTALPSSYVYAGVGVVILCLMLVPVCCSILIVCMWLIYSSKGKYQPEAQHRQSKSGTVLPSSGHSFPNPLYGPAPDDNSKADSLKKGYSIKAIENPYEFRTETNKSYVEGYDNFGAYSTTQPGFHADYPYSEIQHDPSTNQCNDLIDGDYTQMDSKDVKTHFYRRF